MASKGVATIALLVALNLLFFTMVSSTYTPCPPPPHKKSHPPHKKSPPPHKKSPPSPSPPKKSPPMPSPPKMTPPTPLPSPPKMTPPTPLPSPPKMTPPTPPSPSPPKMTPPTPPSPSPPMMTPPTPPSASPPSVSPPSEATCPRDTLKLGVCADLLSGVVGVVVGTPANTPCCSLIEGLTDLEAAVCLCTAIKANVLGINLNIPVSLSLLLNTCGKKPPTDFQCS